MSIKKKELAMMVEYLTGKVSMLEAKVASLECTQSVTLEEVREFDISAYKKHNETSNLTDDDSDIYHPAHYTDGKYEVWDFIDDYGFGYGYHMGCAIKYMSRAGKKDEDTYVKDLKKARVYLLHWYDIYMENPKKYRYIDMHDNFPEDRINISDYCKDKGLPLELTKAVNFIILGQIYNAYLEVDKYIKYLKKE